MSVLNDILSFNENFVKNKEYIPYETSNIPNKHLVIFTCMDTRLVELLPKALNIKNGDVKMVKNAGAVLTHPFGSTMRSILVAVYELQADEVMVIGHHQCGMSSINPEELIAKLKERGVDENTIKTLENAGIELKTWFKGFDKVEDSVAKSVEIIKNHPLMPKNIPVHGLVIDPNTGKLDLIVNGYENETVDQR
ncbi:MULTISPECIES: beta-class carbonic anhydrase [Aeribacillus]|jgi:carbonic anhydrase|uniref:beta-class carbonic anhydrase n=1 Tax=Aeribacillus TaxID=1055323 RepID=UPI0007B4B780|nr:MULTISPECIES: carbonic anhydrase [Aeribacillus]KZM53878.1 carbonic anhydrase [Aeribacillus pallidus]MDR9796221.1 carbonic anhydrase [Aeribacillus pallidus]MED0652222.1 carbonic anhydrase [Aeribacillus composti]MED0704468.1 carbonic anhydrase [Aeribacillus composti]MED0716999.1 carbonic anhydrase [Aeribacillus composti]